MTDDPYAVLGVTADADLAALTAARRRLALTLHPDVGGDAEAMQTLNRAFDEAVRRLSAPRPAATLEPPPATAPTVEHVRRHTMRGVQHDSPSFTIDVLPVEAFEALLLVTSWMGEVLVDDPPYLLEVFLHDPTPCWCRLDLVPDAGATTVSLMVADVDGAPTPDPEWVRDEWVTNLNRLGDPPV
ncbi:MAG: hypothetical protein RL238_3014 [Actinomycetota bacterium]|jgi:hypothetical protein